MRYSNQAPWKSVRLGYLALNALRASIAAALSANELTITRYIAFSALNVKAEKKAGTDGLEYSYIDEDPEAMRIEEPLFWLLYQMGVIEKAQKKQRKANKSNPFLSIFGK